MKYMFTFIMMFSVVISFMPVLAQEPSEAEDSAAQSSTAPIKSISFGVPIPSVPFHHIIMVLNGSALPSGKISEVVVDGKPLFNKWVNDVQFLEGGDAPYFVGVGIGTDKTEGKITGGHDFQIVAPCNWTNGSTHTIQVCMNTETGEKVIYESEATAPDQGGYWDGAWKKFTSFIFKETAGISREKEPVVVTLGVFADDLTAPDRELRVVTYAPGHPAADPKGYLIVPHQVLSVTEWRDEKVMASEEVDPETHERVHRYDPTKTIELAFLVDLQPSETRIYQVLYGNPEAQPLTFESDLKVAKLEGLGRLIANNYYEFGLSTNSGMVETVKILGSGEPVLLEHRIETNGAVHWNPDCYSPPTPWVHVSDWENPEYEEVSGPLLHRDRRFAPLPHMTQAEASVSYTFYAGKPYVIVSTLMEILDNIFVQALRNNEIVFNHQVLDEFVWQDSSGQIHSLPIEGSKKHPIHALEISPRTPWIAFISRKHKVGFASILLDYANFNRYGKPASELQPYIYVQNGPWIYWSRGLVYPFGGKNITRMVQVQKGAMYYEKNAWVPFRFAEGENPFSEIQRLQKTLTSSPEIVEWSAVDDRTPEKWVMPILTMPFDEGVEEAISGHKKRE